MDRRDIIRLRLRNQGLTGGSDPAPGEVVHRLGAVQSQEFEPALWSVGQRLAAGDVSVVRRAFDEGTILRTHVMRPTWHFVAVDDLRWLLGVTGPRVQVLNGHPYRIVGLDQGTLARSARHIADALSGGRTMTRAEIGAMLGSHGVEARGQRLAYIVMHAELEQIVCSGPLRGSQHTYALFDERVPESPPADPDDALRRLALRYFRSHGPATLADLRWWSSITAAQAAQALEAAAPELEVERVDGKEYWFAGGGSVDPDPAPAVLLLQGYDEYFSHADKALVDAAAAFAADRPGKVAYTHAVVSAGRLVGHWRRKVRASVVALEVALYRDLDDGEHVGLVEASERYAQFLGKEPELTAWTM